jgi:glycosyltransferase involved in cell wall biosynthesis
MKSSIIIPWADREELATTLRANRNTLFSKAQQLIIANCSGDLSFIEQSIARAKIDDALIIDIAAPSFNKGLAINLAVSRAVGKNILLLDNDIVFGGPAAASLLQSANRSTFATPEFVVESPRRNASLRKVASISHHVEIVLADGRSAFVETSRQGFSPYSRSAPGVLCVRRERFVEAGGMNSDLAGWGWEDIDLIVRLQLLCGMRRTQRGRVKHVSNESEAPNSSQISTKAITQSKNFSLALVNYMAGDLHGTFDRDASSWVAIEERTSNSGSILLRLVPSE